MLSSISRETIIDRRQPILRWGAIFAGVFVASASWVLLQMLGVGAGLVAVDRSTSGLRNIGVGTTIWSLAVPLVALFIGGLVAGRFATSYSRGIGALHGFIMWAFSTIVGTVLIISSLAMLSSFAERITVLQPPSTDEAVANAGDAGQALLYTGLALAVSLLAAVLGGALGVRRHEKAVPIATTERVSPITTTERTAVPPPPVIDDRMP